MTMAGHVARYGQPGNRRRGMQCNAQRGGVEEEREWKQTRSYTRY
jgi:hypothetical protein